MAIEREREKEIESGNKFASSVSARKLPVMYKTSEAIITFVTCGN